MRTLCSLLLICCLLLAYTTPAVGSLIGVSEMERCHNKGGYCYFYCFSSHKKIGSCFPEWPRCCKKIK
ncbi:beta-defensin 9 isoform X2 [Mus pahari]|uniref:beta-defensin 9 isoform X2 n=1 Tax=Mus pahari TaxID=10093 RepID=UPI000A30F1CF|nr:beta-defensin 9 isoform X2 [Mus pahari]